MEPCKQITTCHQVNEKQSQESELKPKQQKTQQAEGWGLLQLLSRSSSSFLIPAGDTCVPYGWEG